MLFDTLYEWYRKPAPRKTFSSWYHRHISCVPIKTVLVVLAGRSLCSKQDIPCVPSKTFLAFQAGHSLFSKQDIPCVPRKTSLVIRSRKMYTPLFDEFGKSSQDSCELLTRTPLILGRSTEVAKQWHVNSQNYKIAGIAPISIILGRNRSRRPKLFSQIFARTKNFSRRRTIFRGDEKKFATHERSNERGARNCQVNAVVES